MSAQSKSLPITAGNSDASAFELARDRYVSLTQAFDPVFVFGLHIFLYFFLALSLIIFCVFLAFFLASAYKTRFHTCI